ncbi:Transcriptional regulator, LysR family [Cronobacter turicensis 564]|nr:Transcriptional regulator, LysR family [Cronobacter turicensis 564]
MALVPASFLINLPGIAGLTWFELPVATRPITVSQMWHPRLDADPAHRWLRQFVLAECRARMPEG